MSAICLSKLIDQMDGLFGCNIIVKEASGVVHGFSFEKKTLFDLIKDVFCSAGNIKKNRVSTIHALKTISNHLDTKFDSQLKKLVSKYEAENVDVDFKEVREILKNALPQYSIKLSPIIYSKSASVSKNLWSSSEYQALKTAKMSNFVEIKPLTSAPAKSARIEEFEKLTAVWKIEAEFDATPYVSQAISFSTGPESNKVKWPIKQGFEETYQQRLDASICKKTYNTEKFYVPDGVVSDNNLAVLAETTVEIEKTTKNHLCTSVVEKFRKISKESDLSLLECIADHGEAKGQESEPETETDFKILQAELNELIACYQMAPLNTGTTSRW